MTVFGFTSVSTAISLLVPLAFMPGAMLLTRRVHGRTVGPPSHMTGMQMLEQQARSSGKDLPRRRRRDGW